MMSSTTASKASVTTPRRLAARASSESEKSGPSQVAAMALPMAGVASSTRSRLASSTSGPLLRASPTPAQNSSSGLWASTVRSMKQWAGGAEGKK